MVAEQNKSEALSLCLTAVSVVPIDLLHVV